LESPPELKLTETRTDLQDAAAQSFHMEVEARLDTQARLGLEARLDTQQIARVEARLDTQQIARVEARLDTQQIARVSGGSVGHPTNRSRVTIATAKDSRHGAKPRQPSIAWRQSYRSRWIRALRTEARIS
jgi:hypothetical protein